MKTVSSSQRDRAPLHPLRRALVFPLVWQILIAVGVAGGAAFWSYQRAADDLSEQVSHEIALSVRERVASLTETPHRFLRINKAAFATENLSLDNLPRLQAFFWRQVQIDGAVDTFYFSDTDGRFLLVRDDELRLVYVREEKLQRRIYQLDEMGNRLDLIAKDSYDPRQRPWYQAAIAARDATWSPIYTFSAFPELGISPSIPLYDETGQLQGVMAVDISLKQLDDFLGALDLGRSGKVFVVEPDGAIVASSVAEPPYRITNEGRERLRAVNSSDPLVRAAAQHLVQTYGRFDRAGDNLQFHARSEGKAYFTQLTRIRDGRGLDWITVVAIPRSDLMQPFYRSAYIALLACMGVAIASISFGTWQARRIARPILELSLAAREIASGSQFDRPVSGGSIAEIQGLADAFSRMVQRLQHSLSEAAQLNHTLEVRVRDRTADLERAKQDAEAANAAKSAFLAVMSHELRTPMNAVIGMADVLLLDELAPRHRDSIETIRNSSDTLLAVINDILDVSKIEADRVEIESAPFSLLECVEAAIALVTPQATAKSLDLTYRIAPDAPSEVVGDITRLRQICVNLLGNAVKFTESGSVSLTLSARSLREPEGHRDARTREGDAPSTAILSYPCEIHCEVRDTGIGIAPDRVEQLFEPFAQGDASTTRIYGGTGLGLTICKRLCALMGGHIGVESQLGEGSTFRFTVRVRVSPEVAPVALPHLATGQQIALWWPRESPRAALQALLQGWGADVTLYCLSESPSPHSMENDETPFDLAIVAVEPSLPPDHPLSPGLAIARRVSQRDVPLILLSANPHQTAARLSDIAPPLAVLSIPVRQSQLQSLLAQHFSLAESKTGLAAASIPASPPAETALLAEVMPLRVLLAEDVAVNQTVILALLNCLGYTADVVADGRTALEAIATLRYDLVSIDIHMPYMDGLDVMRQWRQRPEATPTKPWIIATTARALPGDRETCLAAGANDYLSKPIRLDALRDALLRFQRQTAPETATEPASAPPPTFPDKSFDPTALDLIRTSLGDAADATLAEIIDLYLDRSTVDLETITRAIATDDPGSLQDASHSLKSASATVGAMAIAAHCERLETLGRLNTTEGASSILSQLQLDFPIAIAVLKSVRPETSDADDINA